MSIRVDYDGSNGYSANRPYADIYCHGISGRVLKPVHLAALIDTGADYLELPNSVATQLGITLSSYPTHSVLTAGGYAPVRVVKSFSVEIEGKVVAVTAHFLSISTALLGLDAILSAIDLGFDVKNWLYKK
jgi:predicted aspartyl protease